MGLGIVQIHHTLTTDNALFTLFTIVPTYNTSKAFKSFTILCKSNTDKSVKTKRHVPLMIFGS